MVKILILLLSFGLSTLVTLLADFGETWQVVVGIIGFGIAFILAFAVLFFLIIGIFDLRVKKNEIPTRYSKTYRRLYTIYQSFLLSLFSVKLTVNGMDKVPNDTNFILLQNHRSNVDPIFTDFLFKKYPMIFVAKESLFKIPFFGKIVRHIGYVKLCRKSGMDDATEIIRGLRWVRSEECSLCVYPEGTRNKTYPNPKMLDLKEGTLAIAKKAGKPIVISAIHGTEKINDKLLMKIHKIQVDVVEVIKPEEYADLSVEELTSKVSKIMLDAVNNPLTKKEKTRLF